MARSDPGPWEEKAKYFAEKDLKSIRREFAFPLPKTLSTWLGERLNDKRDLPVACALVNMLLTVPPGAITLYSLKQSNILGLFYFITVQTVFLQRYLVAVLHTTEHRRLFKNDWVVLNGASRWLLAPFFGLPLGGAYYLHHVVMHHTEDNHAPSDLSSTEKFQRDNFLHFLRYWLRHVVAGMLEVPIYALYRQRYEMAAQCFAMEILYLSLLRLFWILNPVATFWAFVLPFLTTSLALMFGNWSQHIFLNPARLKTPFGLTYNCLATPDNQKTFNDGYHILHHMNSRTHWSELPALFLKNLEQHAASEALVFHGVGVLSVGLAVFSGNLSYLVEHLVPCGSRMSQMTKEELISLLKERLKPVS
eukprot:jgi/Botrbrau1/18781/Bobra.0386s0098.2